MRQKDREGEGELGRQKEGRRGEKRGRRWERREEW